MVQVEAPTTHAGGSEFKPWNQYGRRQSTPPSSPLTSTCMPWYMQAMAHTSPYIHTQTKINIFNALLDVVVQDVILILGRWRQEFKAHLSYTLFEASVGYMKFYLKKMEG